MGTPHASPEEKEGERDCLRRTLPLRTRLEQKIFASHSPFHQIPLRSRFAAAIARGFVGAAEFLIGARLYVKNEFLDLAAIDSRALRLIDRLLQNKIIDRWGKIPAFRDLPPVEGYYVSILHPRSGENPRRIHNQLAFGLGRTAQEAMVRALAETFERHSLLSWREELFLRGSFRELASKGAVSPSEFQYFSERQLGLSSFFRSVVSENSVLRWIAGKAMDGSSCLVPAQLVFLGLEAVYPDEPIILPSTTNGAAAARHYNEALGRALCEVIERDGLFLFWLNGIPPPKIAPDSIPDSDVQENLSRARAYGLELSLLNITTDIGVPSYVAVLIDRVGPVAVSMSAAADFDGLGAVRKVVREVMKFPILRREEEGESPRWSEVGTIQDRSLLWKSPDMIPRIEPFLSGEERRYVNLPVPPSLSWGDRLRYLARRFRELGLTWYSVDVTTPLALHEELRVVRAIVPGLVPAYFSEGMKPLGVYRLFSAPVVMGLRGEPMAEEDHNSVPHPFL